MWDIDGEENFNSWLFDKISNTDKDLVKITKKLTRQKVWISERNREVNENEKGFDKIQHPLMITNY